MVNKRLAGFIIVLVVLPIALFGCKSKVDKSQEMMGTEATSPTEMASTEMQVTEPAQNVATETIPPTAAPQIASDKSTVATKVEGMSRNKDIQMALKAAGYYTGSIDGKIGPKTKKAIEEFQKAKGLKVDGKVGPKTWAELEKFLTQQ